MARPGTPHIGEARRGNSQNGGQRQRQADQQQLQHAAQPGAQRHVETRIAGFEVGQALQRRQGPHGGREGQGERQRSLVQQEGSERREQGKPDQAARITQLRGFRGLDREHRGKQGAAGVAAEAQAGNPQHGANHEQGQQQAQGSRQRLPPGQCGCRGTGNGNGPSKVGGELQ
jgi:hypothetical protein